MYTSFTEFPVWQKALDIAATVFQLTTSLPRSEDYGLTSQIRRSSNSVCGNVAEGFGRKTKKDKSNFYIIARSSAFETQSHLLYGHKIGYFQIETIQKINIDYNALIYELNKIIKSLE